MRVVAVALFERLVERALEAQQPQRRAAGARPGVIYRVAPDQAEKLLDAWLAGADRFNSILRFDDQMLVSLNLWGTPVGYAPMLHLRRGGDDGLFEQFAEHFEAIWHNASEPAEPNPEAYPPPAENPERYAPITEALFGPVEH